MEVRVSTILIKNNRILFLRYEYPKGEVLGIPGGGVLYGESLVDALQRELKEELGVDISIKKLLYLGEMIMSEKKKHTLHIVFLSDLTKGVPKINPLRTTASAVIWLPPTKLADKNLYPDIKEHLLRSIQVNFRGEAKYIGSCMERPWM